MSGWFAPKAYTEMVLRVASHPEQGSPDYHILYKDNDFPEDMVVYYPNIKAFGIFTVADEGLPNYNAERYAPVVIANPVRGYDNKIYRVVIYREDDSLTATWVHIKDEDDQAAIPPWTPLYITIRLYEKPLGVWVYGDVDY